MGFQYGIHAKYVILLKQSYYYHYTTNSVFLSEFFLPVPRYLNGILVMIGNIYWNIRISELQWPSYNIIYF